MWDGIWETIPLTFSRSLNLVYDSEGDNDYKNNLLCLGRWHGKTLLAFFFPFPQVRLHYRERIYPKADNA